MGAVEQFGKVYFMKVNVIIECYDMLKTRFPFTKPVSTSNIYGNGNAWDNLYNKNNPNYGFNPVNPVNTNAVNPNNWNANTANNNVSAGWGQTNNVAWGNNNTWGANNANNNVNPNGWNANNVWGGNNNNNQWGGNVPMGGMGGITGNSTSMILSAQKLVAK